MSSFKSSRSFSRGRKCLILLYNLVILTSLVATAIRDLNCDMDVIPPDDATLRPQQTGSERREMASNEIRRKQINYAAATLAGVVRTSRTRKYRSERARRRELYRRAYASLLGGGRRALLSTTEFSKQLGTSAAGDNIVSEACSGDHGLEVQQDNTTIYFEGLPVYHVTIINTCLDCSLRDIHIACGDWASATLVNPQVFKRVADNNCLVNNGNPISSQGSVIFEYTNSFPYPMDVKSTVPSCP